MIPTFFWVALEIDANDIKIKNLISLLPDHQKNVLLKNDFLFNLKQLLRNMWMVANRDNKPPT